MAARFCYLNACVMEIYHKLNIFLEERFHALEAPMPSPELIPYGNASVLRYKEEHHCLELAIVQKLARYISGLNASLLLLKSGLIQETGVIFRTLGEFGEDILFLSLPIDNCEVAELHKKYLEDFFQEELDNPNSAFLSTQKRKLVIRRRIWAAIAKFGKSELNPHDFGEVFRTLSQGYSGYVHGPSCHICEMVDGNPLRYCLAGMAGTSRQGEFIHSYWNYACRGLSLVICAAKVLGDATVCKDATKVLKHFEKMPGRNNSSDLEKIMKELKRKST